MKISHSILNIWSFLFRLNFLRSDITQNVVLGVFLYWIMYARRIFRADIVLSAETEQLWSAGYFFSYSLRHWHTIPWWDPTALSGWPAYFLTVAGWFNYLSPIHALSWMLDLLIFAPLGISINGFLEFQKTIYIIGCCVLAISLISRELISTRALRFLPTIIFVLGQFPFQAFLASSLMETMPPSLFLIWSVIKFSRTPCVKNLNWLIFSLVLFCGSISYGTLQSSFYWVTVFIILFLILRPRVFLDLGSALRESWRCPYDRLLLCVGIITAVAGLVAFYLSVSTHLGMYLRATGGANYNYVHGTSLQWGEAANWAIYNWPSWVGLLTWTPFSDIHDSVLKFDQAGATIDHRYLGIITLPGLILGLIFVGRDRRLAALILSFVICTFVIPYTVKHLAFRSLIESSFIFQNIRTMAHTMPREGPGIFLILIAAMGIDRLFLLARAGARRWTIDRMIGALAMVLLAAGFAAAALLLITDKIPPIRHSLAHLAIYGTGCALILAGAGALGGRRIAARTAAIALLVLTMADLSVSSSFYWERGRVWVKVTQPNDRLPEPKKIGPIKPGEPHWVGRYFGMIHRPFAGPFFGDRAWLTLVSRGIALPLLPNIEAARRAINAYPSFSLWNGGRFIPYGDIATFDDWVKDRIPELDPACRPTLTVNGAAFAVAPGSGGSIEATSIDSNGVMVRGWGIDAEKFGPPPRLAAFWDNSLIAVGAPTIPRWDVFSGFHPGYVNSGFELKAPYPGQAGTLRVYALGSNGVARELVPRPNTGLVQTAAPPVTAPRRVCASAHPPLLVHDAALENTAPRQLDLGIEILKFRPNRVRIATSSAEPGWLVHWDQFDPHWRATVDGQPVAIERANFVHKAVALPAGQHIVELIYDPVATRWGWIGYWGLFALFLVLWMTRGRQSEPKTPSSS